MKYFDPEKEAARALGVSIDKLRIVQANHSIWSGITYAFGIIDGSAYVVFQKLPRRRWIERIIDNKTRTKGGRSPKVVSERFL